MRRHFQRWGAAYILAVLFIGSWIGQLIAMRAEPGAFHSSEFWAATFENWQSEWFQLLVQGIALLALKHVLFKADAEDLERIEAKIDSLVERQDGAP